MSGSTIALPGGRLRPLLEVRPCRRFPCSIGFRRSTSKASPRVVAAGGGSVLDEAKAIAAGADGLILEVHPDPEHALSDGAQSLTFDLFASVMANVAKVAPAVGKRMERAAVAA